MHKAVLTGFLAISLACPVAAYAQPAAPAPAQTTETFVIQPTQWLAIGAGVLVGAAVLDVVLPSGVAFVVGGAIGGYLANAWYSGHEVEVRLKPPAKI